MGIIKFKLLFIISSLVLALLPVSVMANTLQPGQNFNSENTEEQNESMNDDQGQQQNDYSEPSRENGWTGQEEPYDEDDNNNYNENYNNNENYYDGSNSYNNGNENYNNEADPGAQQEPVQEEPVEPEAEYEEPVIEEPVEEVPVIEEEPVEIVEPEPTVDVNTLDAGAFSISGEAVDEEDAGIEGVELILSGESFDGQSVVTDGDGSFLFEEVPSGNYQIEIKPAEDYEVPQSTVELEVTDRSKRGLEINLTAAEEAEEAVEEESEPVKTDEDVMAAETGSLSSMDWTLVVTGIIFAMISLFVLFFKKAGKN